MKFGYFPSVYKIMLALLMFWWLTQGLGLSGCLSPWTLFSEQRCLWITDVLKMVMLPFPVRFRNTFYKKLFFCLLFVDWKTVNWATVFVWKILTWEPEPCGGGLTLRWQLGCQSPARGMSPSALYFLSSFAWSLLTLSLLSSFSNKIWNVLGLCFM